MLQFHGRIMKEDPAIFVRRRKTLKKNRYIVPLVMAAFLAMAGTFAGCGTSGSAATTASGAESTGTTAEGTASGAESAGETAASDQDPADSAAELGQLKSFTAGTLDGETFTEADLADKDATIINFWATTCGPCISEMPELAKLEKALPDRVQLITVCLDGSGSEEEVKDILANAGYEGTTIISGSGDLLDLVMNLQYTPTTVIADSEGNLRGEAIIGSSETLISDYEAAVNAVLKKDGKQEISINE